MTIFSVARSRLRGLFADHAGSVLTEAALALPIMLGFCFGIIEVSRAMWIQNSLQFASEAASRCAAIGGASCDSDSKIKRYASARITDFHVPAESFAVTSAACGKRVTASYAFKSVAGGLVSFEPNLTADACHP